MKIIDTSILNKFLEGNISLNSEINYYVTDDLIDEIEILKLSKSSSDKLDKVNIKNVFEYHYFNESNYYKNYKYFLNKYKSLASFYNMKGIGDISILSAVKTIIETPNPSLFDPVFIEVLSHDAPLKNALKIEFGEKIKINDLFENTQK